MTDVINCAVVIGIGTGERAKSLSHCEYLTVIGFPGENPDGLPGKVFMVSDPAHAAEVISKNFSGHNHVVTLPETIFFDTDTIAESNEPLRKAFCREFYMLLTRRPFDMGDDVIDCLQGAEHIAKVAKHILPAPMPHELAKMECPAIAIATGPSLSRHIDRIRELQNKCLIIACDSAVDGLLKNGIFPHVVTPFERVVEIRAESFTHPHYDSIFCGNPVAHPEIAPLFDRHIYMPGTDLLYLWAEAPHDRLNWFGQSTGTLSICVGMNLTNGPVYMVGHDLAFSGNASHWKHVHHKVQLDRSTMDKGVVFDVPGYSGPVATQYWWDVFRREIEGFALAHGNIINTNAPDGVGAFVQNTLPGSLPHPDGMPDIVLPTFPEPNLKRLHDFRKKVRLLPNDARTILTNLSTNQRLRPEQMDLRSLCPGPNRLMFSYILRSILGQFSLELRNRKQTVVIDAMVQAMRNSLRGCMGIFEEMAACV